MNLTADNCFDDAAFCAFWDAVEDIHNRCWDDGVMLDMLIELYSEGCSVTDAADQALEAYEIGIAEAWMELPSWA